jgi:hypothetical protein
MFKYGVILLSAISISCFASDPIAAGKVKNLSYRAGWVMFKVVNDSGVNLCQSCPTDPGSMNRQHCWIKSDETAQISMLLSAQARDKKNFWPCHWFN